MTGTRRGKVSASLPSSGGDRWQTERAGLRRGHRASTAEHVQGWRARATSVNQGLQLPTGECGLRHVADTEA